MKAKKPKKIKKRNLVTCPQCGSINISVCEQLDLVRVWCQDESGPGGLLDFEQEADPKNEFLSFACESCPHSRTSEEFSSMEELMEEVYGRGLRRCIIIKSHNRLGPGRCRASFQRDGKRGEQRRWANL